MDNFSAIALTAPSQLENGFRTEPEHGVVSDFCDLARLRLFPRTFVMVEAIDIKATASPESFYTARLTGMKSGAGWVEGGLCPFHQDTKTGSFRVNLDTGAYKCFSCGASGGDVIDFAMQQDDVDFPTTIKALAAEYGIAETPLTAKQIEVIRLRQQQAKHDDLDDGIFHEAHIILQCVSGRENNRNLEHNRQFREARPD